MKNKTYTNSVDLLDDLNPLQQMADYLNEMDWVSWLSKAKTDLKDDTYLAKEYL
jgi:transcription elongation factor GreA-like protein